MVEKDVEMFLEACELKGLSMKTIGSLRTDVEAVHATFVQNWN